MPEWAATAAVAAVGATGTTAAIVYGTVYVATTAAIAYGVSAIAADLNSQDNPGQLLDIQVASDAARQLLIGVRPIAGSIVGEYVTGYGLNNLVQVIALADHRCEACLKYYANGVEQLSNLVHGVRTEVTSFRSGGPRLWVTWFDGRDDQTADTTLAGYTLDNQPDWTTSHRGRGVSYAIVEMQWDSDNMQSKVQSLFLMKGARLYDRRKDSTAGGSGTHRHKDPSTWQYSNNPDVAADHYQLGIVPYLNAPLYSWGIGLKPWQLPYDLFKEEADISDELVTMKDGVTTQARYAINSVFSAVSEHKDIITKMAIAKAGRVVDRGGHLSIVGPQSRTPVMTLYDTDLVSGEQSKYSDKLSISDLKNTFEGRFPDPKQMWRPVDFPRLTDAAWLAEDGGDELTESLEIDVDTDEERVQRLVYLHAKDKRRQARLTEAYGPWAIEIEAGDWYERVGQRFPSGKLFECTRQEFACDPERGFYVIITGKEVDPDDVAWDANQAADLSRPPVPSQEVLPPVMAAPTLSVSAVNVTGGGATFPAIAVALTNATTDPRIKQALIEIVPDGGGPIIQQVIGAGPDAVNGVTIDNGIAPDVPYVIRAQYLGTTNPSDWSSNSTLTTGADYIVTEAVTASEVADGSITTDSFAAGLTGVEIVASLPVTGNFVGRTVALTTDGKLYRYTGSAFTAAVPTVDLTGTITGAQIGSGVVGTAKITNLAVTAAKMADATITAAKFAAGLTPVEIVATLPTTGNFVGRVVALTTDGKLYRYDGSGFVASVPAADITGTLTNSQIADLAAAKISGQLTNAQIADMAATKLTGQIVASQITNAVITADKFASGLTPVEVMATLPVTGNFTGRTVMLTSDGKLYRYASGAFTAAIPAADVTGTLSTTQLADGAVTAAKVASAAIDLTKFASGLTAVEIVATLPVSGNYTGRTVMLTSDGKLYRYASGAFTAAVATSNLTGTVATAQIADDAITSAKIAAAQITTAKFASGITPVEVLATLPVSGNFAGRTVFLTTDSKLYRHNGTAFTAAAAAADITGQLTNSQIADLAAAKISGTLTNSQIADLAATKLTGQVVSSQIADAAISAAKFASGLTPVEIVATLPVSGNFTGRTVMLTSDGKLYRYVSGAFTAAAAAADVTGTLTAAQIASLTAAQITGQITSTQITDNSITTAKVNAGAITTAKVAASAITATEIATDAVTAAKIQAGAITTAKLSAGAVTANEIASNAITTAKLAAGAVTAATIAAGAITATKLLITDFTNLTADSYGQYNSEWSYSGTIPLWNQTTTHPTAPAEIRLSAVSSAVVSLSKFPAVNGDTFRVTVDAKSSADANADIILTVWSYDKTDTFLASHQATFSDIGTTWATRSAIITVANASAAYVRIGVFCNGLASGYVSLTDFYFTRANAAELIVDGGIIAAKIAAGAITTAKLAAGAVTASEIASDAVTAVKILAGSITTAKIAASAVTATEIATDAVTAVKIQAGSISTAKLQANAVTANELAANSVVSGKIQAGAVSAAEIAAGAITASKIYVGDNSNMCLDPVFQDTVMWTLTNGWAFDTSTDITTTLSAPKGVKLTATGANPQAVSNMIFGNTVRYIAVEPSKSYRVTIRTLAKTGFNGILVLTVNWYDSAGNFISGANVASGVDYRSVPAASNVTSSLDGIVTSLSNAAYMGFYVQAAWPAAAASAGVACVATPRVHRAMSSELIVDGQIITAKLAAGAITTAKIAASAVTAVEIATDAITAVKIQAGAITTAKIAANAVTANEIAADAITSAKIAAGAITATKLLITDFTNLTADSYGQYNSEWSYSGTIPLWNQTTTHPTAPAEIRLSAVSSAVVSLSKFPAVNGDTFRVTVDAKSSADANADIILTVWSYDKTDTFLASHQATFSDIGTTWATRSAIITVANASAAYVRIGVFCNGLASGYVSLTDFYFTRANAAELIVDGAIIAAKIASGAITTAKLSAGAVTANEIGTDAVTAVKIQAGSISTAKLQANAVTSNEIAANAITAAKIAAGVITASHIATQSITADKLVVMGDSLIPDPNFAAASLWYTYNGTTGLGNTLQESAVTNGGWFKDPNAAANIFTPTSASIWSGFAGPNYLNQHVVVMANIPVMPGEYYELGARVCHSANHLVQIGGNWLTSAGAYISGASIYATSGTGVQTLRIQSQAPANAAFFSPYVVKDANATAFSGAVLVAGFFFRQCGTGTMIVDGSIVAAKIAAGAITTAKLSANAVTANEIATDAITAVKVQAGAITTAKIAALAVTAAEIAADAITTPKILAGAITTAKITAGAVTATELASNSVTAVKIQAGVIVASHIASNVITASKLVLTDSSNMVSDAEFLDALGLPWRVAGTTANTGIVTSDTLVTALGATRIVKHTGAGTGAAGVRYDIVDRTNSQIPVDPSKPYAVSLDYGVTAGFNGALVCDIEWRNAANSVISYGSVGQANYISSAAGSTITGNFSNIVTAPAGAINASFRVYIDWHTDFATRNKGGTIGFVRPRMRRAANADLIVDGSVTAAKILAGTITATQIAANAITATQLNAGAVTTAKLATGAVTANEIAANTITTGKMAAGAITTTELAAGAVTAAKMTVTSLASVSATIGLLRTATTGARTEIEDNQIRVYDASNVMRVRIGVW